MIEWLSETLGEAAEELAGDVLRAATGDPLFESYLEVKRSEWEMSVDEDGEWESEYLGRSF